jgi:hypothetical protein
MRVTLVLMKLGHAYSVMIKIIQARPTHLHQVYHRSGKGMNVRLFYPLSAPASNPRMHGF